MRSGPQALARLAHKYERLLELRREATPHAPTRELRELAKEFPGALRELDALSLQELERRLEAVRQALEGGEPEVWIDYFVAYHAEMRAALWVKRRLEGERRPSRAIAEQIAQELTARTEHSCSPELVLQVASPPRGRLSELVLGRLGLRFGRSPRELRQALFSEEVAS